jgi:NAD(P)H-dependent FMN reductase
MKIVIVSASTRERRTSHRVAMALEKELNTRGIKTDLIDLKAVQLKPFEERLIHLDPKPENLVALSEILKNGTSIIFVTPEYNGMYTSALKNFMDVFGRAEFAGKPIGVATASTGAMGGMRAALHLQQSILAIQAYPQPQILLSAEVNKQLDEEGNYHNDSYPLKLNTFLDAFIKFSEKF